MLIISLKKGALIASLFFALNLGVVADDRANTWYKIGYDYSQRGRNTDAFKWMSKSADAGHAAAQNNIGLSYLHALGAPKDEKTAFFWFEKAAKQGLPYAQSELAMLYYEGTGVEKDTQKAYDWWLMAAKQEDEYAQFNLASLFLDQNDIKQAYYWFNRASNNNHPDAKMALDKLREQHVE
ncbi:MAG: sel1 repeat family protein [Candidatus Ruthia sp.]|nr:sel1 repeat family protein [Candidatus Ruthturnera sp.]